MNRGPFGLGMFLIGALVGGVAGGLVASDGLRIPRPAPTGAASLPTAAPPAVTTDARDGPVVDAVRELGPTVVTVVQRSGRGAEVGSGSGWIIDAQRGFIATNNHVVVDETGSAGSAFDVILSEGKRLQARLVGRDPETDVAVLQIDTAGLSLKAAPIGDSDAAPLGATVVAIGSPLGEFKNSVTSGVLSGKGRRLPELSTQIFLEDLLQTDAPISPGNSGGPLIWAAAKQVIGMNTLVVRETGAEGLGFAVSSNTVRQIAEELIKSGRVQRGKLGIRYQFVTPRQAPTLGLPSDIAAAAVITSVDPGSAADRAGLRVRDAIVKVNETRLDAEHPLATVMLRFRPGDRVRLTVFRDGREQQIEATLGGG
ncbi:MAG TPA: trypsin-like peptidase domain-containing protein [Candidatus Limnocylindria bacterium]|nr:trypsin-like peptidase domain-containing protein [Candidatus Limnocylindria bacterium]